ncbi:twin-arginine translocase TatA/TatE family subunit [Cutibacterium avidum]|uniref:twin-arginine translocase TatA/TatE family subunit n=1 Tax=Cutibacterium avidum TaxID=33010 RepID=UPI0008F561E5|nr:twin-arginine translocase TatA/TatE family subunit [Cutibacterium avidum]MDK7698542.1 twin-arginine translocase TatA/TatE family subunit [Cutibacterium avidum]OIJ77876.1 preprotein translocase subunit TatA [Cutibacterium avidum]
MAPLLIANEMTIIIIIVLALVLFGGSRIAGVGKGAGRAIREFKEETAGLDKGKDKEAEKDIEAVEADVVKDQSKPTE